MTETLNQLEIILTPCDIFKPIAANLPDLTSMTEPPTICEEPSTLSLVRRVGFVLRLLVDAEIRLFLAGDRRAKLVVGGGEGPESATDSDATERSDKGRVNDQRGNMGVAR